MDALKQAYRELTQELDAIHQRAGEIEGLQEHIRKVLGVDFDPEADDEPKQKGKGRNSKKKAAAPVDEGELGKQETGRRQKILAALTAGPLATREVAIVIKVDRKLTKMALQRMAKVGLVKGVGAGPGRRWTLPGTSAKEGL